MLNTFNNNFLISQNSPNFCARKKRNKSPKELYRSSEDTHRLFELIDSVQTKEEPEIQEESATSAKQQENTTPVNQKPGKVDKKHQKSEPAKIIRHMPAHTVIITKPKVNKKPRKPAKTASKPKPTKIIHRSAHNTSFPKKLFKEKAKLVLSIKKEDFDDKKINALAERALTVSKNLYNKGIKVATFAAVNIAYEGVGKKDVINLFNNAKNGPPEKNENGEWKLTTKDGTIIMFIDNPIHKKRFKIVLSPHEKDVNQKTFATFMAVTTSEEKIKKTFKNIKNMESIGFNLPNHLAKSLIEKGVDEKLYNYLKPLAKQRKQILELPEIKQGKKVERSFDGIKYDIIPTVKDRKNYLQVVLNDDISIVFRNNLKDIITTWQEDGQKKPDLQ